MLLFRWNRKTEKCIALHLQPLFRLDNLLYHLSDTVSNLLHELTTGYLWFKWEGSNWPFVYQRRFFMLLIWKAYVRLYFSSPLDSWDLMQLWPYFCVIFAERPKSCSKSVMKKVLDRGYYAENCTRFCFLRQFDYIWIPKSTLRNFPYY